MEALTASMPLIVFVVIGAILIASAILVIAMRNPVHSALFLLLTFLCVAVLFVMKSAEFVAAVQVLVYAGGIMVLFLFVIMFVNVRHLPEERIFSALWKGGLALGIGMFALLATVAVNGVLKAPAANTEQLRSYTTTRVENGREVTERHNAGNSEAVGMTLYRDYLVPFEVASLFLLVAMIGAIVIGKRELSVEEEETTPAYILDRAESEQAVKEALNA